MCGFQFISRVLWPPDPSSQSAELIVYITSTRVDLYNHQILFPHRKGYGIKYRWNVYTQHNVTMIKQLLQQVSLTLLLRWHGKMGEDWRNNFGWRVILTPCDTVSYCTWCKPSYWFLLTWNTFAASISPLGCLHLRQWPVTYLMMLFDWTMSCQPGPPRARHGQWPRWQQRPVGYIIPYKMAN